MVHTALQHQGSQTPADASTLWQNGSMSHQSAESRQPVFTSYPPLAEPPTYAQTDAPQPPSASTTAGWSLHPHAATAVAIGTTAGARQPPSAQQRSHFTEDSSPALSSGRQATAQSGVQIPGSPPSRAVSPFESIAEMPFTPPQVPKAIVTSPHSDRLHFAENPLFTPLDTPEGCAYRYVPCLQV